VNYTHISEISVPGRLHSRLLIGAVLMLMGLLSCDQPFDPRAPLDQKIVLYSVLSTDRDAQFVRAEENYMPSGFDPSGYISNNIVRDAIVTMKEPGRLYRLRDTSLARSDTTRYKFPLQMFTLTPFTPRRGISYDVLVQSPSLGVASASVVVPGKPTFNEDNASYAVLSNAMSRQPTDQITYTVQLSSIAKGYVPHLYVYYDVLKGSEWVEERVELPIGTLSTHQDYFGLDLSTYPQMTSSPQTGLILVTYKNGFFQSVIRQLTSGQYANNKIIYKWVVFVLLQAEENLFNYYLAIQEFKDPRSIRLDEPLFTTVNGGLGFAGAYALDSLLFALPENFGGNRR
jgi:hypothetical protein